MAKVSEQTGKTVLSDAGRALGRVERVLVDPGHRRAIALYVRAKGLTGRHKLVPLAAVDSWSKGGPRLSTHKLPPPRAAAEALRDVLETMDDPIGWPVATDAGRVLGRLCDLRFAGHDGTITSIEVTRGIVGDLASGSIVVRAADVIDFSSEGVVVKVERRTSQSTSQKIARMVGRQAGRAVVKARHLARKAADKLERLDD